MKASGSTSRQTGSMGMPLEMKEAVQRAEMNRRKPQEDAEQEASQPVVETGSTATPATKLEDERQIARARAEDEIRLIEEEMGIKISPDDIIHYVKQGRLLKAVEIVPNALAVTYQTLTGEDLEKIEAHMFEFRNSAKATSTGIETEQALTNLSYGLAVYNGRNVANMEDKTKVLKMLRQLGALQLNKVVTWYNLFNKIVDHRLNDKDFLKKS